MHNRILITLMLLLPATLFAQATVVEDRANVGQLKRMVYEQWDDWQPSPETNWLGFPVNLAGFIYWRILHTLTIPEKILGPGAPMAPLCNSMVPLRCKNNMTSISKIAWKRCYIHKCQHMCR